MTFRYRLTARPRWLRWLLHPLLAVLFRHDTRRRLRALKAAVGRGGVLAADQPGR